MTIEAKIAKGVNGLIEAAPALITELLEQARGNRALAGDINTPEGSEAGLLEGARIDEDAADMLHAFAAALKEAREREAEWAIDSAVGQRQLEVLESALRTRIWNGCKAVNMKDDAAIATVEREIAKVFADAHAERPALGDSHAT